MIRRADCMYRPGYRQPNLKRLHRIFWPIIPGTFAGSCKSGMKMRASLFMSNLRFWILELHFPSDIGIPWSWLPATFQAFSVPPLPCLIARKRRYSTHFASPIAVVECKFRGRGCESRPVQRSAGASNSVRLTHCLISRASRSRRYFSLRMIFNFVTSKSLGLEYNQNRISAIDTLILGNTYGIWLLEVPRGVHTG